MTTRMDVYTYFINPFMFALIVICIVVELMLQQVVWAVFITAMSVLYWWMAFEDRRTWEVKDDG